MAVDEACSNIIEHAYDPDRHGDIKLSCCIQAEGDLVISIHDAGRPFDPTLVPEPPMGSDWENLPEGGLGLYFMRRLMDQVTFHFDEQNGNTLTMLKRRPK
jgi:serine/threonine-protein kinase RsbW